MSTAPADLSPEVHRLTRWRTFVCLLLLGATFLNYANRFAFTQNAMRIQEAFETDEAGYGELAGKFSMGFACGGLLFGILADIISVRILYPLVVVVWSLAGISSGLVGDLFGLGVSRFLLGLFEAGHWPCALRTTQRVFLPDRRVWANSVLQSGASLGAVATPMLVLVLFEADPALWRWTFFIVGGLGLPWAMWWLWTVREDDVRRPVIQTDETSAGVGEQQVLQEVPFYRLFLSRRWWLLLIVVVCINTLWHYVRVWMPVLLEKDHKYSPEFVQTFSSCYYLSTFFGSIASGVLVSHLAARVERASCPARGVSGVRIAGDIGRARGVSAARAVALDAIAIGGVRVAGIVSDLLFAQPRAVRQKSGKSRRHAEFRHLGHSRLRAPGNRTVGRGGPQHPAVVVCRRGVWPLGCLRGHPSVLGPAADGFGSPEMIPLAFFGMDFGGGQNLVIGGGEEIAGGEQMVQILAQRQEARGDFIRLGLVRRTRHRPGFACHADCDAGIMIGIAFRGIQIREIADDDFIENALDEAVGLDVDIGIAHARGHAGS